MTVPPNCTATVRLPDGSEQVQEPVYVRYAWHNYCQADLYGESGLPAAPFRTDHFSIEDREG